MSAFVDFGVDDQRGEALWSLRNANQGAASVHVGDDPVAVESPVGQHRVESDPFDQGGDPHCVEAVARQQNEANEVPERVGQGKDLRCPTAFRLADRLSLSSFAPCPWR